MPVHRAYIIDQFNAFIQKRELSQHSLLNLANICKQILNPFASDTVLGLCSFLIVYDQ